MFDPEVAPHCPTCTDIMGRRFSFTVGTGELVKESHFNHSVGEVVSSDRELRNLMAAKSEAYTAQTGIPSRVVPIDPRESHRVAGVTAEGLESTIKRMEAAGEKVPISKKVAAEIGL
jgi:hypothetical protein